MKNLLFFVILSCSSISFAQMNTEKLMEKAKSGVVFIKSSESIGTGFLVSEDGHVVTNYHVMDGAWYSSEIEFSDGTKYDDYSVIRRDIDHDLALLKIKDFNARPHQVLPVLETGIAESGWDAATIGHPRGSKFTINKGIVSKEKVDEELDFVLMIDVPVNPGNSGGPLFNKNGKVIGVVVARIEKNAWWDRDVQNMNLAINVTQLRKFLNEAKVKMQHTELLSDADINTAIRKLSVEEENAIKEANISITEAEEDKRKKIIEEEKKKEQARITEEKELEIQKIEQKKLLESLNTQQKAELLQLEFEAEKARKQKNLKLELQRIEEQQRREQLKLEKDILNLDIAKSNHQLYKKEYYSSLPGRFGFRVGGGTSYYLGTLSDLGNTTFNANNFSWQSQFMLGYRFDIKKRNDRGTWVGLGMKFGNMNKSNLQLFTDQQSLGTFSARNFNSFGELELTAMLREWFKVGFGLGRQYMEDINNKIEYKNYKNVLLGASLRIKQVEIDWNNYLLFADSYKRPGLKSEISLFICFHVGKF
jgi:hypothetical protein